jgi:hypothetical protein
VTSNHHNDYHSELAGLKRQLDEMDAKIGKLTLKLTHMADGNGRQGYYRLLDDVYGPQDRTRIGVMARMGTAEDRVTKLESRNREILFYLRGFAAAATLFGLDMLFGWGDVIRAVFGS